LPAIAGQHIEPDLKTASRMSFGQPFLSTTPRLHEASHGDLYPEPFTHTDEHQREGTGLRHSFRSFESSGALVCLPLQSGQSTLSRLTTTTQQWPLL
jgi:hypothetical protein